MQIRFVPSVIILQSNRVRVGKRTRASKPKVRSGCLTCKQRHVKCDERKPYCLRCELGLYTCDGYTERPVPEERDRNTTDSVVYESSRKLPLILPKPIDRRKREASGNFRTHQDIPHFPSSILFDERDATYFDLFRTHIVKDLSGYVYSEFWSRTILRESIEDECVRHCVLGIGALSRSLQYSMHPANQHVTLRMENYELNQHREAALKHYGKALGFYRQQMEFLGDRLSTRRVLAVTLLLLVFEFLQGHIAAVDGLITCSVKLLRKELRTLQSPSLPGSDTDEAEDLLARLSALSTITPSFPSSQKNCGILNATPSNMVPDHRSDINTVTIMWKSSYTRVCIFGSRSQIASFNDSQFQSEDVEEERHAFLRNLREWKVFLVSRMKTETHAEHLRSLLLMTIQCHIGSLYVRGCTDSQGGITYDRLTDEYRQIISLFKLFLEDPGEKPRMSFTFEIGILPSICMIIHTCRHQDIRDDAASILSSLIEKWGDFREGPWDSRMLAKGFRALMTLEKAGMDKTGFIPPSARYRWTGTTHDKDNSRTTAVYTSLLPRENVRETKHVLLSL